MHISKRKKRFFPVIFAGFFLIMAFILPMDQVRAADVILTTNTRVALQAAVTNAGSTQTTIYIKESFIFDQTAVSIPSNANITIRSDTSITGSPFTLTQTDGRHFSVSGSLTLEDIILDGNTGVAGSVSSGGVTSTGKFYMNNGAVIRNCYFSGSGGGILISGGTFTMNGGTITGNKAGSAGAGVQMASTSCTFTMNGGVITGNTANGSTNAGSGVFVRGFFYMNGGEISNNTASSSGASGGGVCIYDNGTLIMGNSTGTPVIKGNRAPNFGGAVYIFSGTFAIYSGQITNNSANYGGGVYLSNNCSLTINGGSINNNTGNIHGGGVYVNGGTQTMNAGTVSGNKAVNNGGGIYVGSAASLNITGKNGKSEITGNNASSGGGIYTGSATYSNITMAGSTVFNSNTASAPYNPPANAATLYPNLGFAATSIASHPLNNYDINYISTPLTFRVTYDANGGTGSYTGPNITMGKTDTVLSQAVTQISRQGHLFTGWNTKPEGVGEAYAPGDTITLNKDVTLYAQWQKAEYIVSLSLDSSSSASWSDLAGNVAITFVSGSARQTAIFSPQITEYTGYPADPSEKGISILGTGTWTVSVHLPVGYDYTLHKNGQPSGTALSISPSDKNDCRIEITVIKKSEKPWGKHIYQ